MLRQHMSKSSEAPEAITHERSASADERETLREAQQRSEQLAAELAQEISRGEQVLYPSAFLLFQRGIYVIALQELTATQGRAVRSCTHPSVQTRLSAHHA